MQSIKMHLACEADIANDPLAFDVERDDMPLPVANLLLLRCVAALLLLGILSFAQTATQSPVPFAPHDVPNLPQLKIGPDDLIGVTVYDSPELTRTVRVLQDGAIRLPIVKARIKAAGLMPADLELAIADALTAEDIMVNPIVTVSVAEYRSRPITVSGAVRRPLSFQATGNVTLLDAIARAEGLAADAGSEILVSRSQPGPGRDSEPLLLTRRIPVKGLIDAADPELNVRLEGGEEIRVPESGKVFVVGNVKKPGAFLLGDSGDTSVLKVLALSEGLMPYATDLAYVYRREGGSGGKNEIPIELKKIIQRKSPDVPLLANDVLYVPDNTGKRKTMTTLDRLATFGAGTVSGLIIWGSH